MIAPSLRLSLSVIGIEDGIFMETSSSSSSSFGGSIKRRPEDFIVRA